MFLLFPQHAHSRWLVEIRREDGVGTEMGKDKVSHPASPEFQGNLDGTIQTGGGKISPRAR